MRRELLYGLYLGIASIVWVVLMWVTGLDAEPIKNKYIIMLYYILPIIFIAVGLYHIREKDNGGYLKFGAGFGKAMILSIVAGIIYILFNYIYINILNPDYMSIMLEAQKQEILADADAAARLEASGMTVEQALYGTSSFMNSPLFFVVTFLSFLLVCTFISLIVAAIIKKNPPRVDEPTKEEIEQYLNEDEKSDDEDKLEKSSSADSTDPDSNSDDD